MSKRNRERRERKKDLEHGWIVELSTPYGYPMGRFWFNAPGPTRTPPGNAQRMAYHTQADGRLEVASMRPTTRVKESR